MTLKCPPLLDESADEKTPVSSYFPPPTEQRRSGPMPRCEGAISGHRPILPQALRSPQSLEPSVIVGPGVVAEANVVDSQLDTVYMTRRRYARKLELALVAALSATLAAAITLFLTQALARGHSSSPAPVDSNRLATPVLAVSLSPPPIFEHGSMDDRR